VLRVTDFINLLIAIHTALSILRPRKITQESGLFPYRYQAYASFVVFSFLLPSLAFINPGHDAYVSQGTFCALPVRPFWYRLVLSWIPRYLILLIIIGVYMTIYIYTRRTFGTFDATFSSGSMSSQGMGSANSLGKSQDIQVSPEKAIPPCAPKSSWPPTCKLSTRSAIAPRRPGMSCIPPWRKYSFTQRIPVPRGLPENGTSHTKPNNLTSLLSAPGPRHRSDVLSDTVFRTPTLMEALHDPDLLGIKRRIPSPDPNIFLRVRHQEIQRQLRKMFIYPLVYLLMWIPAFVNHCYFYTKNPSPPFALSCISLACLCLQCAVDSLVFSIREKPWLYKVEAEKAERGRKIADAGGDVEMRPLTSEGYGGAVVSGQGIGRHSRNLSDRMNGQSPQQEKHWWDDEGLGTP